jgi:hypothetical protein
MTFYLLPNLVCTVTAFILILKKLSIPCHSKLLTKLESIGIKSNLLNWINSFLSCRTQRVYISGCFSNVVNVISGVPQGSVLGPLLFLIFINDIVDVIDPMCSVKIYANDLKIYCSRRHTYAINHLQRTLNNIVAWSAKWQLDI